MKRYSLVIHGGAGTLVRSMMTPEKEQQYIAALDEALETGFAELESGGTAVDAVEAAVIVLENTPLFNAGRGSVFTHEGTHEMDAAIMDGKNLNAGAVALLNGIKNPISLARDVMEKSEHVFLAGEGALKFAKESGYQQETDDYFFDAFRFEQWQEIKDSHQTQLDHSQSKKDQKFGTVGAVACDKHGNIAAATSTGGMTNKRWGRIGDSPVIGAGNYANNKTCAVSCTGSGEFFIRGVAAYDLSCLMEFKKLSLKEAADEVIQKRILELGGDGGLIATDINGNIAMPFNTEGMYRAYKSCDLESASDIQKKILIYSD